MKVGPEPPNQLVEHLFRHEAGQLIASLTKILGIHNLAVAEEIVQDTLLKALQVWPYHPPIEKPVAWLRRVARNKAIDFMRHHHRHLNLVASGVFYPPPDQPTDGWSPGRQSHPLGDELVQMLFVCCTPALTLPDQVALCLQLVGGLSAKEIASAFLIQPESMRKRLYRAKNHLKQRRQKFALPKDAELPSRMESVLAVLYLMFNEGYHSHSGPSIIRQDLCHEALRLLGLLQNHPRLQLSEVYALGALMRFQAARLATRLDAEGDILLLADQDRRRWDRQLIAEGFAQMAQAKALAKPETRLSPYHLEAGIAGIHCAASTFETTNWQQILILYEELQHHYPSPMGQVNHLIAIGHVHGPEQALAGLQKLREVLSLRDHYLLSASLGEFAMRAGYFEQALDYFNQAIAAVPGKAQKRLLAKKHANCRQQLSKKSQR